MQQFIPLPVLPVLQSTPLHSTPVLFPSTSKQFATLSDQASDIFVVMVMVSCIAFLSTLALENGQKRRGTVEWE